MSKRNELNSYIERIRQRLLLAAWVRGAAIFTGTALIVTIALVLAAQSIRVSRARAHRCATGAVHRPCRCGCIRHCIAVGAPHACARRAQSRSRKS